MSSISPSPDEEWGTDYEGRIGIGGKGFSPLAKHPSLDEETREQLIAFQRGLPLNVYGFVYESSVKGRYWMGYPFVVLAQHTTGTLPPLLTLLIVLDKQYSSKPEITREVITEVMDRAHKFLQQGQTSSIKILIVHRDELVAYLTELWLAEEGGADLFYRLR